MGAIRRLQARWWVWRVGRDLARARLEGDVWRARVLRPTLLAARAMARGEWVAAHGFLDAAEDIELQRVLALRALR